MTKEMDLNKFLNDGYLQEVNRQFFHPLGLALAVEVNEETGKVTGIPCIWEDDDPEGYQFGYNEPDNPWDMAEVIRKAKTVNDQRTKIWHARYPNLGFTVEPIIGFDMYPPKAP
jgi:hypothetical protein